MFTLHLSRFLSGPPGPEMQKLNAFLHKEPYAKISHSVYWCFVLCFGAPLFGISLIWKLIYELFCYFCWHPRRIEPKKQGLELAIVITGCDSGFGNELVFRLAAEGFIVFAGCLKKESFSKFSCEPLIQPLVMDVTSDEQVNEAFQAVQKWLNCGASSPEETKPQKKRYLHALVNNAGAGRLGYIDWAELSDFYFCMEVNYFAQVRASKAFLPIFKQQAIDGTYGDSRIVNMVSMAGMLSAGGVGATAYEVSKNAAEAFTDALRLEMKMFGVKVVSVNPSFHSTPLVDDIKGKLKTGLWKNLSPNLKKEYGTAFFEEYATHVDTMMNAAKWDFKVVVDLMVDAIQSSCPPAQLLIGLDARFSMVILRMLPQWIRHYLIQISMPHQVPAMLVKEEKRPRFLYQ